MARVKFVAGNWKMNTNKAAAVELAKGVVAGARRSPACRSASPPPFVYLDAVGQVVAGSNVLLGAQDAYFEKNGAFTGEISVEMLKDLGVKFCLTGHSERRHVLKETAELVGKKADADLRRRPDPRPLRRREARRARRQQDARRSSKPRSKELNPAKMTDPSRLVIAYEPVWAIGTGRNATDAQAQEVHAFIRQPAGQDVER